MASHSIPCVCRICGKTFHIHPSQIKYGRGKFCSKKCQGKTNLPKPALPRILANLLVLPGANSCWVWTGRLNNKGYVHIRIKKKKTLAHRWMYEYFRGPIPKDLDVCHTCDNPSCLCPNHFFVSDHQGNMADKVAKGRQPKGVEMSLAKLTDDLVREIRASNDTDRKLSKRLGVAHRTVGNARSGSTWRHVV